MEFEVFLNSLRDEERDFIAGLDYGNDLNLHRSTLDAVIEAGGEMNFETMGFWHPYEVIELGMHHLQAGHEREYAACLGIVLKSIERGADKSNEVEWIIEQQAGSISALPPELRGMISEMAGRIIEKDQRESVPHD